MFANCTKVDCIAKGERAPTKFLPAPVDACGSEVRVCVRLACIFHNACIRHCSLGIPTIHSFLYAFFKLIAGNLTIHKSSCGYGSCMHVSFVCIERANCSNNCACGTKKRRGRGYPASCGSPSATTSSLVHERER